MRLRDHAEFPLPPTAQLPEDAGDELRESVHESLTRPRHVRWESSGTTCSAGRSSNPNWILHKPGWIDWRRISRSWTSRERLLSELAFGTLPRWTRTYLVSTGLLVVCLGPASRPPTAGGLAPGRMVRRGRDTAPRNHAGLLSGRSARTRLGEFSQGVLPLCTVLPVGIPEIAAGRRGRKDPILPGMPSPPGTGSFIGWYHSTS